jgi:hypothetical protein
MLQQGEAMQRTRTRDLLLWIAATDATFEPVELPGGPALQGKCIHCNAKQTITLEGRPISRSTVEHIVPQCHGGTDALDNLAIACSRCNGGKGVRHDSKPRSDPKLSAMIELLEGRRRARMRPPLEGLRLPPLRGQDGDPGREVDDREKEGGRGRRRGRGRGRR